MTLSEREWLTEALAAIEPIKTEMELLEWDESVSSDPRYLTLPDAAIKQLEDAYKDKLGWLYGIGGG